MKCFMSLTFKYPITVKTEDIDVLNHVNNEVYLRWLIQSAVAHSEFLGYGLKKFLEQGSAFVVRRHELDYLRPAFLGEELVVETWIGTFDAMKTTREYRILRQKDEQVILKGKTVWVYIDLKDGKPKIIPEEMSAAYKKYQHLPVSS